MTEIAGVALATFFATIGPFDVAAVFAGLTARQSSKQKFYFAARGTLIATGILSIFAILGDFILSSLGISLAALRTAGGILLLLIGIDMVFAGSSDGTSTTDEEETEASTKSDITVFPLATPLIAGPGAVSAAVLLMTEQSDNVAGQVIVIASMMLILLLTFISMLLAGKIQNWLGLTGMHVVSRVIGVLLTSLAVQFIFDGIKESNLLGGL